MTTRNLGEEGFRWFIGVVEDRNDPLQLGRLRIRVYNVHSMKQSRVTTEDLPWATVMIPVSEANYNKVGKAPVGIQVGTTVIGFFADGEDSNNPIIMGAVAGIPGQQVDNHDLPPEAREINTVNKTQLGPEPASAYRAKYPYNKVLRTEGGHVVEVDDTPGFERIHIFHKSGTYVEIDETGRYVVKTAGDAFEICAKNKTVFISGSVNVEVKGNVNLNIDGTCTGKASSWNLTGDVNITGNVDVKGNIKASQQISDSLRNMSSDRAIYNSHTHSESIGTVTSSPNGTM